MVFLQISNYFKYIYEPTGVVVTTLITNAGNATMQYSDPHMKKCLTNSISNEFVQLSYLFFVFVLCLISHQGFTAKFGN